MGKLGGEMKALAKHCGGSHKTVNDCIHIVQRFDHHLRALNVHMWGGDQFWTETLRPLRASPP